MKDSRKKSEKTAPIYLHKKVKKQFNLYIIYMHNTTTLGGTQKTQMKIRNH